MSEPAEYYATVIGGTLRVTRRPDSDCWNAFWIFRNHYDATQDWFTSLREAKRQAAENYRWCQRRFNQSFTKRVTWRSGE